MKIDPQIPLYLLCKEGFRDSQLLQFLFQCSKFQQPLLSKANHFLSSNSLVMRIDTIENGMHLKISNFKLRQMSQFSSAASEPLLDRIDENRSSDFSLFTM